MVVLHRPSGVAIRAGRGGAGRGGAGRGGAGWGGGGGGIYSRLANRMLPTLSKTGQQWRGKCLICIKIFCRQLRQIKSQ